MTLMSRDAAATTTIESVRNKIAGAATATGGTDPGMKEGPLASNDAFDMPNLTIDHKKQLVELLDQIDTYYDSYQKLYQPVLETEIKSKGKFI